MDEVKDISLKNKQVNKILGKPPQWLIRWGSLILLLLVAMLFGLSAFVVYPETITANTFIIVQDTNQVISANHNCKLYKLFVKKDYQLVNKADPVMITIDFNNHYDTIRASNTGEVLLTRLFSAGDTIPDAAQLFTLLTATRKTAIEAILTPEQALKAAPGMTIIISLTDYPQDTYGILKAAVITRPSKKNNVLVCEAKLLNPWPHQFEKVLFMHKEIKATISLVISKNTLLLRMLHH